jgi:plastocyanin
MPRRGPVLLLAFLAWACTPPAIRTTVVIKDLVFGPDTVSVRVGETVVWSNQDLVPHTATAPDDGWDTEEITGGAEKAHQFPRPGRFAYRCRYHPAMQGVVDVKP